MTLHVKKGDNVLVIAGKDKGKSGKVLTAIPADNAVVVSDVNIIAKHKKPKNAQDKGGIIRKENKIDASNVLVICPECGKATRVSYAFEGEKKFRKCKKCGASLDKAVATKKEVKKEVKQTKKAEAKVEKTAKTAKPAEKKAPAKKAGTKTLSSVTKATTTKATAKRTQAKGQ